MEKKRGMVHIGRSDYMIDPATVVHDIRGVEDIVAEAIETDWNMEHYIQFDERLFPFADAADIADWDREFLGTFYPPLYTEPQEICHDCHMGPCNLKKAKGKCGLEFEAYQAKLNLRSACRGCLSQMMDTREVVNYAIKIFGKDKAVDWGMLEDYVDVSHIRLFCGMQERSLADMNRAQSYVEEQLNKLLVASFQGIGSVVEFEGMASHAASMLIVTQDIAELVKMSCFGLANAADHDINDLEFFPWMVNGGLGSLEPGKPAILFVGDNFLPGWVAVNYLKEKGLTEQVEICGVGPAGDDIARFYDRCRVITGMVKASKTIRSGLAGVIVASSSCISFDILADAQSVESRLIWISKERNVGLPDRTDDPVDKIVEDLIAGAPGAWIRDCEKAGEVAVKAAQGIKRKPISGYLLSEDEVKKEAKKCRQDCDLCFNVCPNSLMIGKSLRKVAQEGLGALAKVEEGCYFCHKCEEVCPQNIRILDLIIASQGKRAPEDKFVMRAGRGATCRTEAMGGAWGMLSNSPGWYHIMGCGDAKSVEDIGWMADELVGRNCPVHVCGCAANEVARYFDKAEGKFIFEKYGSDVAARCLINHGGCPAASLIIDQGLKWSRTGPAISLYANFAPIADMYHCLIGQPLIIWGALSERMRNLATAWARSGAPVVVGPASAFGWKRFLLGNKWDWERWWSYIMMAGGGAGDYKDMAPDEKRHHEPAPKHMIIPVETKEEAIATIVIVGNKPCMVFDARQPNLETYIEVCNRAFGEYPDDWHQYVRSDLDLPQRQKPAMLRKLREEHGWEIERVRVTKQVAPDGRMLTREEFANKFSIQRFFPTKFLRGMAKPMYFRTGGKKPEKTKV